MDRDTQERPREDGSRAWSDGIPSEEGQSSSHRHKLRERRGRILPHSLQREGHPADTLISGFWLPELGENKLLLCQPVCGPLCFRSLWSFVTAALQSHPRPSNSARERQSKKGECVTQGQGDGVHGRRPVWDTVGHAGDRDRREFLRNIEIYNQSRRTLRNIQFQPWSDERIVDVPGEEGEFRRRYRGGARRAQSWQQVASV